MTRPYSMDLRDRVVAAVEEEGLSRHQAATRFGIAVSTAVHWVRRYRTTGSVAPGKVGGHKKRVLRGEHAEWLIARCQPGNEFTISQLVAELLVERGLKVDRRQVWEFLHAENLSFKKRACSPRSRIAPTSPDGVSSGSSARVASPPSAWCSSTRPGPRPT